MDAETKAEFRVMREEMKRHDERAQETNRLVREFITEVRSDRAKNDRFHFGPDGRGGINGQVTDHEAAIGRILLRLDAQASTDTETKDRLAELEDKYQDSPHDVSQRAEEKSEKAMKVATRNLLVAIALALTGLLSLIAQVAWPG